MADSYGLALGSGSARGLAHIGVLKVLEKNNISVSCIAGSSIGALIGAHYCAFRSAQKLEDLVYDIAQRKLMNFLDPTLRGGFLKGNKIEEFLTGIFGKTSFDTLKIPFAAVTTDMYTGNRTVLTSGDLIKSIRASIAIPGILRPVHYKNTLLSDGGLSDPIPVTAVQELSSNPVIAVNLDTFAYMYKHKKFIPISRIPLNSINILRHNLALTSVSKASFVISPVVPSEFFAWNDFFNRPKIESFIKEGERAAIDLIPLLKVSPAPLQNRRSLFEKILNVFKSSNHLIL